MTPDIKELRDETFRRIGRNVVNFQRLELTLKALIPSMSLSVRLQDFPAKGNQRIRELKYRSLGNLVQTFREETYEKPLTDHEQPAPDDESIILSLRTNLDSGRAQASIQSLLSLVKERNRLIHHDVGDVDFSSREACDQLCALLDEQNERICKQLSSLNALRETQSSLLAELRKFVESEEFLTVFLNPTDAD